MAAINARFICRFASALLAVTLAACQGGGGSSSSTSSTVGSARTSGDFLFSSEVGEIISAAVQEASARGVAAVIAVTDRVGNVLAVFSMTGASTTTTISSQNGVNTGLENTAVPATAAAIAKAVTASYLSSNGNAFTTRTASFIIQETFPPNINNAVLGGGPLFGVQFSQLPCSDLNIRFGNGTIGPKRSPLGLSADPGGVPLYIGGTLVGGIGVVSDGIYGLDRNPYDTDTDTEELIAVAGAARFFAPTDIQADRITVLGQTLRFVDQGTGALQTDPTSAPTFGSINGSSGSLTAVTGYYDGSGLLAGTAFGTAASGIRAVTGGEFSNTNASVLVDATNSLRFPFQAGASPAGNALSEAEVRAILDQAITLALSTRAQIRRPLGSFAQVTISVVDTAGRVLGQVRTADAPIFGTDVSLQKARSAMLLSNIDSVADLTTASQRTTFTRDYLAEAAFFDGVNVLPATNSAADTVDAFSAKSLGNLSRPFFPDGQTNNRPGPYSLPIANWSIFSTGIQLDLAAANLVEHLQFVTGASAVDTPAVCARTQTQFIVPEAEALLGSNRLANGLQIFSGGFPIYRNGTTLVGGIGVSGDGIDQDDLIGFLALDRARTNNGLTIGNARTDIRADNLAPFGVNLRYVGCPVTPFLNSNEQNPCDNVGPTP